MTEPDWRKVTPPARYQVRPPAGAPNVVIVLMDQLSYADPATFGGPIRTPTLDRLAANGVTYPNFHVNALCSPTRMSLLTGRNQHQCSAATVVDTSTGFPGDTGVRPDSCATVGEILRRWGYVTALLRQVPRGAAVRGQRQRAVRPVAGALRVGTSSTATWPASSPRCTRT